MKSAHSARCPATPYPVANAVTANPCTRICFRVGDFDIERAEHDFNLKTSPPPAVEPAVAQERRERILALSREKYARRREEVEAVLAAARPEGPPPEEPRKGRKAKAAPEPLPKVVAEPKPAAPPTPAATPSQEPAPPPEPKLTDLKPEFPEAQLPGRGGREHKYLQQLLKRLGEDRGYRAVIEQSILDGTGSVDVSLEKGERKIACEISVTTDSEHELGNLQKCLAAGYETVIAISSDPKTLRKLQAAAEGELQPATRERLRFLQPDDFITYLDELAAGEATREETVRGYRVKTRYRPVSEAEAQARKQAISKVLLKRAKRNK